MSFHEDIQNPAVPFHSQKPNGPVFIALALVVLITAITAVNLIYTQHLNEPPIRSDGYGYYLYLPALVIDKDLTFSASAARLFQGDFPNWTGIQRYPATGLFLDKYTFGTALLQAPFFLAANALAVPLGYPADGFSDIYQTASIVSAFFYLLLGMWFLYNLLSRFLPANLSIFTLFITLFGTSLFHYATYDASFSHVYSFCLTSAFLFFIPSAQKTIRGQFLLGALLGLIALVRVPNLIIGIFIPLYGILTFTDLRHRLRAASTWKGWGICLVGVFIVFLPQMIYWKFITGHFLVNSYLGEGFNWYQPQILPHLFSIRKGLFFWTPLSAFVLLGIILSLKFLPDYFFPLLIFIPIQVYINASWHSWEYGGSFGQRPYVDTAALFALGMGVLLLRISDRAGASRASRLPSGGLVYGIIGVLVGLNLLFMIGYWYHKIPFDGTTAHDIYKLYLWYRGILKRLILSPATSILPYISINPVTLKLDSTLDSFSRNTGNNFPLTPLNGSPSKTRVFSRLI